MSDVSSFRFVCDIPVRWVDVDSVGVINNACYLTYLEQARFEYCRQLQMLEDGQFPFVLGETTLRFQRPGPMDAQLRVASKTERLGRSSFTMVSEIRDGEVVLATASATLVYVDGSLGSRPIPDDVRDRIRTYEGLAG